jgi:hypothetical protein
MDWIMLRSRRPFLFFFNFIIHEIGRKVKFHPEEKMRGRVCIGNSSRIEKFGSWDFVSRPREGFVILHKFSQNPAPVFVHTAQKSLTCL